MSDLLSDRYAELLTGSYDCVDRTVLKVITEWARSWRIPFVVAGSDRVG